LTVVSPPTIAKAFGVISMGAGSTTALTFILTNPNTTLTLNALAFTDNLPAGLVVATPSVVTGICDGGTITATAGGTSITLAGASLTPGASCTFSVDVTATGTPSGLLTNTTSTVTSVFGAQGVAAPVGAAATASIFVGDPYQLRYFSNLNIADSVINITNTGERGAANQSGTTASITGAICVNAYAFSPDEQMVACCSCPVTPNGLVSLSAKSDLISNTLTPAVPTSIVVKLVASIPVARSCTSSAAVINQAGLAPGMLAWGATIHDFAGAPSGTETPFSGGTLSAGELARLSSLCGFINSNGSGFGICRSCRLGGLGAAGR
jgi:hypothetical protein